MFFVQIFVLSFVFKSGYCNWITDWMYPVKAQIGNNSPLASRSSKDIGLLFNAADLKAVQSASSSNTAVAYPRETLSGEELQEQLEAILSNAKGLADTLSKQISLLLDRENLLKEIIANGRFGTTAATISLLDKTPRTYIIRDGQWFLCRGIIQFPLPRADASVNLFADIFTTPRCVGQEVPTVMDTCAFTSIIRYETIPTKRKLEYTEEVFLCLKSTFNNTLEQYRSVQKKTVDSSCKNGVVRSLVDNLNQCGVRMLSEYSYYPHKSSATTYLPLEYCIENDGSCKLTIGWHIANRTTESFESLKKDPGFSKFFINQEIFEN